MPNNKVRRNGSYAPLSARYYKDDAVATAGERAELLYVRGLAFCAEVLSDGFITDIQLARFVGVGMNGIASRAAKLVEVELWVRDDERGGYHIASWLKWNQSKDEISEKLQRDTERKVGTQR
jgi:hypothetical protein